MIKVVSKIMINSSAKKVWSVISEIQRDPYFWKGMSRVRTVYKNGNTMTRQVTLANSEKCSQKIILFPIEGIHIRWTKGMITGTKDILITQIGTQTLLEVEMNYEFHGIAQIRSRNISEELRNEAELAVQLIKEELEKTHAFQTENRKQWADLINE
ncbi:MAG: SRPBCC family protein [Thaumarchaeota archaeon]|nr:SRPBCC family protein [Nitrososphaerota archaeon]